ncbi:hypothetical protein BGZ99_008215 [Dissophora globulifera]|uniref:Ubiquitin-like domain-containing protein n=1 Tax=Dissophora globulifera TaxID=979702 RepID=A0A9P6UQ15_9FUNG|nr:hypothetical protein BGZ99_008215 [Dissophora globulifera]
MSYVRVKDASDSDSDDDDNHRHRHPDNHNHVSATDDLDTRPRSPVAPSASDSIRRAGSAAAASLASLSARVGGSSPANNHHEYSRVSQASGGVDVESTGDGDNTTSHTDNTRANNNNSSSSNGNGHDGEPESDNDVEIHVRFGEGQDLKLRVPRTDTIAAVKEKAKEARPSISDKYLRLIYAGKILVDTKTVIESLPKSLFTQVQVPHPQQQSRLSSSVEAVEAAASNILAGIASSSRRASSEKTGMRTHTSLGSILPTHISYGQSPSSTTHTNNNNTNNALAHPLAADDTHHVSFTMPTDPESPNTTTNTTTNTAKNVGPKSTLTIPVQTGPIYFLCSLSDTPPAQPRPSDVSKGKAVAADSQTATSTSTTRRGPNGTRRSARNRQRAGVYIPSQSTSAAAAAAGSRTGASSSLALPGQSHGSSGSSSRAEGSTSRRNGISENQEHDTEDQDSEGEEGGEEEEEDLSPIMAPQLTGFDRLREAGFSEEEIRSIRRQFHASRGTVMTTVGENGIAVGIDQDEDATARARRIEEEWIDQHGAETLPEGLEGSYGEMVYGLILGFFMGLIALFWFKEATFSRRQQMGIIAGLMINVGFGVLHLYY